MGLNGIDIGIYINNACETIMAISDRIDYECRGRMEQSETLADAEFLYFDVTTKNLLKQLAWKELQAIINQEGD